MRHLGFATAVLMLAGSPAFAQRLFVYSELTRIDPFGNVAAPDRGGPPRHILSPGFPRNAISSLRVVVHMDKPGPFHLDIAQNPENAVKPMLYREVFEQHGDSWIPDKLLPVTIPYDATEKDFSIPGQKVVTFWLDMTVARNAQVDRIKVEPQMYAPGIQDWVVYPMEVRIMEPIAPDLPHQWADTPPVTAPADAAVFGPLRSALCGKPEPEAKAVLTARAYVRRNTLQHLAIAGNPDDIKAALLKSNTGITAEAVCGESLPKTAAGPEWYLRLRDAVLRLKSVNIP